MFTIVCFTTIYAFFNVSLGKKPTEVIRALQCLVWGSGCCFRDQTSITEQLMCWQTSEREESCSNFSFRAKRWKVLIGRNVLLLCLLSMSWSCEEKCTGKTAHYGRRAGRREGGKRWKRREADLWWGPGSVSNEKRCKRGAASFVSHNRAAAPHCHNQAKDSPTAFIKNRKNHHFASCLLETQKAGKNVPESHRGETMRSKAGVSLWFRLEHQIQRIYYLRIENAEGYVLIAVYLFIHLFVCVLFA